MKTWDTSKILSGEKGFDVFCDMISLTSEEKKTRKKLIDESYMPFKVTEYYGKLIAKTPEPAKTQLINIILPPVYQKKFSGRFDPYGNRSYRQEDNHFIQHKYEKTLLFHIDEFCFSNCQFCYKVNEIRHEKKALQNIDDKLEKVLQYIDSHPEIDNVLVTGGDPAFRSTKQLKKIFSSVLSKENIRIIRFATKGLSFEPNRFLDEELLDFFKSINANYGKQVCIIAQINHPAEFSKEAIKAIKELQKAGVQLRGQPALIRGVNDGVDVLTELQRKFMDNRVVSYYLTIFMPVRGVEQYALTLDEAFKAVARSKRQLGGLDKKGILLASHNYGKFEVCGFFPSVDAPVKIVLKWHQAVGAQYLPGGLKKLIPTLPEDILLLDYEKGSMYCLDDVFRKNHLPYLDANGIVIDEHKEK